jgi:fumarylacetoacetate (FAA) hydrolase
MRATLNDFLMGDPEAGEMHFSYFDLVEHIAETRAFTAGTLLGSGTVSNRDPARGVACLAEKRMREILEQGQAMTNFLRAGDRVHIEMRSAEGESLFGAINQRVLATGTSRAAYPEPGIARRADHGQ